jgi:alanyl-tRNA synthetase
MDSQQIRQTFTDFFVARDHAPVPSASLIPIDPTLLLTNAGMVPFKPYMLGEEEPPWPRAVSIQKCARTVDIDIVGTTARHLTFFEMLGNFSFGDYFKEAAIPWAYELITEGFGMDPGRLWYTVHETDDEAFEIWVDGVGVPADRVQRRDRDNFWQMGVPGPCGPSSEIFYDKGAEYGPDGGPVVDEERFMEFWNLVFMQHIQDEPYHVIGNLPSKNIDTGSGLDRMATLLQGVDTIFEIDTMRAILATAENACRVRYGATPSSDVSLRILADHARAVTFLISDKVVPSNEGRGYVLRRLIRRAVRHAFLLGRYDVIMPGLIDTTVEVMKDGYPELVAQQDVITAMAAREEEQFRRTLESGHQLLDQELAGLERGDVLPGATAFKLHDTFGFPREVTEEILAERGLALDAEEFEEMMDAQRERARRAFKGGAAASAADEYRRLLSGIEGSEFVGYETDEARSVVLSVVREGESVARAEQGQEVEVFLDSTPFYAESGGQVGDVGHIESPTGEVEISDTQFALPGLHGHRGRVIRGYLETGQDVIASIDAPRRERVRKNHTGTHLLHWALREVVGDHAHQAGSLVAPDRLRFDFTHHTALDPDQLRDVESVVNERIIENSGVITIETSKDEAEEMGALAFFGDKYGERVRVVKVGGYSTEFCGGTHVTTAGQIGPLVLVSEGSVAANTRRVEALTGTSGYAHLVDLRRQLERTARILHSQPGQVIGAAEALVSRVKAQEERLEQFETQARASKAGDILEDVEELAGYRLLVARAPDLAPDELRALAFQVRDRLTPGIGVLGSVHGGKGALIGFVSSDLVDQGISAGSIVSAGARALGGGGGKDPAMAQAGGPNGDQIDAALDEARNAARAAITSL